MAKPSTAVPRRDASTDVTGESLPVWAKLVVAAIVAAPLQYAFTIRIGSPLKISEILIALALVARILSPSSRPLKAPGLGFVVLLAAALAASSLWSLVASPSALLDFTGYTRSPQGDIVFYTVFGLFALAGWWLFTQLSRDQIERAIVLSVWLCGAATLLQIVGAAAGAEGLLTSLGYRTNTAGGEDITEATLRSGPFLEGQHLGFFAAPGLLVALARRSWAAAIVAILVVFYSQSTTAVLGLVVAAAIIVLIRPGVKIFASVLALSLGLLALSAFVPAVREFLLKQAAKVGLVDQVDQFRFAGLSFDVREEKFLTAVKMASDHLVLGVGPGRFGSYFSQYADYNQLPAYYRTTATRPIAENVYGQVFSENGLFALVALVGLLAVLLLGSLRARPIVVGIAASVIIGVWTQSSWTFMPIWVYIGYLAVATREAVETAPPAPIAPTMKVGFHRPRR
ncbi:O-antigen ligase family protein [Rathayibacter sp. Leaf296]|uniref:O-antigen ligase family protein n=1 Tax=Rathayibacter sp. Leaf296 TaxID=1736327 RepID=UPI000702A558|nr:O-antigen ligase family protein [Rathayibacter sp. Leaf296]KQQ10640.1 hypothetical protein ASF46_06380 [Rathayibacter sp. Leaf296]